jgi:hypothetical protein
MLIQPANPPSRPFRQPHQARHVRTSFAANRRHLTRMPLLGSGYTQQASDALYKGLARRNVRQRVLQRLPILLRPICLFDIALRGNIVGT